MLAFKVTRALMELEMRHAASDFSRMRTAFSLSSTRSIVTVGSRITSVIRNFPSTFSSLPLEEQRNALNSNFEFSAIARKVVIRQLLTAAVNKCSGDQMPGIPLANCGGVATSKQPCEFSEALISGEHIVPFRSWFQVTSTW